jgi:hypothetical protein
LEWVLVGGQWPQVARHMCTKLCQKFRALSVFSRKKATRLANWAETSKNVAHWPTLPCLITTVDLRSPEAGHIGKKPLPIPDFKTQVVALKGWYNQKCIYVGSCVSDSNTKRTNNSYTVCTACTPGERALGGGRPPNPMAITGLPDPGWPNSGGEHFGSPPLLGGDLSLSPLVGPGVDRHNIDFL